MTRQELLQQAKPILFNAEMVRAILSGEKTVTRRCIRPRYKEDEGGFCVCTRIATGERWVEKMDWDEGTIFTDGNTRYVNPPYHPGDILYVRETWRYAYDLNDNDQIIEETGRYYYAAGPDDALPHIAHWLDNTTGEYKDRMPWRPSIHMPKEAARIFLRVTDVRVERLHDITEEQAVKEGCIDSRGFIWSPDNEYNNPHTAKENFMKIWDSTIKKQDLDEYGWEANPWAWVVEFERLEAEP